MEGRQLEHRDEVVIFDEYGPVRMIRTKEWKYVHRYPYGKHELYHLVDDPGEEKNLYGLPEYKKLVTQSMRIPFHQRAWNDYSQKLMK